LARNTLLKGRHLHSAISTVNLDHARARAWIERHCGTIVSKCKIWIIELKKNS